MKNDGGPAFPGPYGTPTGQLEILTKQGGMSLRDYFAAKAIQGMLCNPALMNVKRIKGKMVANFHRDNIRASFDQQPAVNLILSPPASLWIDVCDFNSPQIWQRVVVSCSWQRYTIDVDPATGAVSYVAG